MSGSIGRRSSKFICLSVAAAFGAGLLAGTSWSQNQLQSYDDYKQLLDEAPVLLDSALGETTKGVMDRSYVAHEQRDTDASIAELGEDYAWIKVFDDGAQEMASGREIAREMTKSLYESDVLDNYLGVDAIPIGIIGNIGIRLEIEEFENEDGSKEVMKTLAIYETKDGKLWRLWAFAPTDVESQSE